MNKSIGRWVPALVAAMLIIVGGCGDSTGPGELPVVGEGDTIRAVLNILVQGDDAPELVSLQETFTAVAGERQTFEMRYELPAGEAESNGRFFRLDLDQNSLLALADGTPIVEGDTVLITVTADPVNLKVQLEPSGLQFNPAEPAELRFWYTLANPDFNGDGVVNSLDDDIERDRLGFWMRPGAENSGEDWQLLGAVIHDLPDKRFRADVLHFSGYVVAW